MKAISYADGACRGNPGPASYGAVLYIDGEFDSSSSGYIGEATNNVAEYRGMCEALRLASCAGVTELEARSDSRLVIEQANGKWRVKHANMLPLYAELMDYVTYFNKVTFTWVPREQNTEADRLANLALDGGGVEVSP